MLSHWFSARKSGRSSSLLAQHREVGRNDLLKSKADASVQSPFPSAANPRIATRGRCRTPAGFSFLPKTSKAPDPAFNKFHSEHALTLQKGKGKAEGFFKGSQFQRSRNSKMFLCLFLLWSHWNFKAFSTHCYFTLCYNQFLLCHLLFLCQQQ